MAGSRHSAIVWLSLLAALIVLIVAASRVNTNAAGAQTPPPTPTPTAAAMPPAPSVRPNPATPPSPVTGCGNTSMAPASAGEPIRLSTGEMLLEVTTPVGTGAYGSLPNGPVGTEIGLKVCHVDSNSQIIISALSGQEIGRTVGSPTGEAILDQIAASAKLSPAPMRPSSLSGLPSDVRPPTTGDGGLLPEV